MCILKQFEDYQRKEMKCKKDGAGDVGPNTGVILYCDHWGSDNDLWGL